MDERMVANGKNVLTFDNKFYILNVSVETKATT